MRIFDVTVWRDPTSRSLVSRYIAPDADTALTLSKARVFWRCSAIDSGNAPEGAAVGQYMPQDCGMPDVARWGIMSTVRDTRAVECNSTAHGSTWRTDRMQDAGNKRVRSRLTRKAHRAGKVREYAMPQYRKAGDDARQAAAELLAMLGD